MGIGELGMGGREGMVLFYLITILCISFLKKEGEG